MGIPATAPGWAPSMDQVCLLLPPSILMLLRVLSCNPGVPFLIFKPSASTLED